MNPNSPFAPKSSLSAEDLYGTFSTEEAREYQEEVDRRATKRIQLLGRLSTSTINPIKRIALQQQIREIENRPPLLDSRAD